MNLGNLNISLGLDLSEIDKAANKVKKALEPTRKSIESLGKGMSTFITGPILAATAGLTALAKKTADYGDRVDKMSQRLGMSTTAFQEWDYVLSQNGSSIEGLQAGMRTLSQRMDEGVKGTGAGAEVFAKLGVSISTTTGELRKQEDVFADAVRGFQAMEAGVEKTALAQKLFGRSGAELLPLLNAQSGSVDELREKARELGLVMGGDAISASVKFTDQLDTLKRQFSAVGMEVGATFLPILTDHVVPALQDHVIPAIRSAAQTISGLITWFSNLPAPAKGVIAAVIGVAAAMGPVLLVVSKVIGAVAPLIKLLGSFKVVLAAVTGPVGIAVVAIGALAAAGVYLYKNYEEVREALDDVWKTIKNTVSIVTREIRVVIEGFIATGKALWDRFGSDILVVVQRAFQNIASVVSIVLNTINGVFKAFVAVIQGDWEGAGNALKTSGQKIWNGLANLVINTVDTILAAVQRLATSVPLIGDRMAGSIGNARVALAALRPVVDNAQEGVNSLAATTGALAEEQEKVEQTTASVNEELKNTEERARAAAAEIKAVTAAIMEARRALGSGKGYGQTGNSNFNKERNFLGREVQVIKPEQTARMNTAIQQSAAVFSQVRQSMEADMRGMVGTGNWWTKTMADLYYRMGDATTMMAHSIKNGFDDAAADFLGGVGEMLAGTSDFSSVISSLLGSLADMAIRVGRIAIGVGLAVEGIKKALQSLNPIAAIAAGAALIAIGSWAKSALAKAASKESGSQPVVRRAFGGPVRPNQDIIVGERGPEVLRLGQSTAGYVVPNSRLQSQQGQIIENKIYLDGRELRQALGRSEKIDRRLGAI
jgi:hypothetical protein